MSTHEETPTGKKYRKRNDDEVATKYSNDEELIPIDTEFIVNKKTFKSYDGAVYALYGKINSILEDYS